MRTNAARTERTTILVIDDEASIRDVLHVTLETSGYVVLECALGDEGLRKAETQRPDVIVLDLSLPDMDGVDLIQKLRVWTSIPILVLSAREGEDDKVRALDAGANDYVTKPFVRAELLARVRVALRLPLQFARAPGIEEYRAGSLRIDRQTRRVFVAEQEVHLTPTEYRLLLLFVQHEGQILTHQRILRDIWGNEGLLHPHYLRVYMTQLRNKVDRDPSKPKYFRTEVGVGYRFMGEQN